jgi:hypothetical protein
MAAIATVAGGLLAWVYDDQVGLLQPFDRVVRDTGFIPGFFLCLLIALASLKEGRAWLVTRVPVVSASALGLFRVALAASLALVVRHTDSAPQPLCLALLALFALGIAARASFALFVVAFTRAQLGNAANHSVALPLKTLWLLIVVPWGAGLSVDALLLRRAGRAPASRSRAYGLAAWIPIAMVGLAYAAAAFAKMDDVGPRWVTGGAVKYFFLVDGHSAPVHWYRYIARSDALSILFSGLAVAGEASVILAAIWPAPAVVAAAGVSAFALQLGFYLFQGVWWSAWWALLPAFLPWEPIAAALRLSPGVPDASTDHAAPPGVRAWYWAVAALLFTAVVQQPIASLLRAEYGVLLSDFPMYSNVYFSTRTEVAAFQEATFQPPSNIRFEGPGVEEMDARVKRADPAAALPRIARKIARGEAITEADAAAVRAVTSRYIEAFGRTPPRIDVLADTWRFDWSVADFVPRQQWKAIATVSLDDGVIQVRNP